jgi:hypothetical protein
MPSLALREAISIRSLCDVLESDAIPDDLEATCLMRTVNGVTEIGVFNLHEGTGQGE